MSEITDTTTDTTTNVSRAHTTADEALQTMADFISLVAGEDKARAVTSITMDEVRNRAIYELNRTVVEGSGIDASDDTFPLIDSTGSALDHVITMAEEATGAIDFILANTDDYSVVDDPQETG